MLLKKSLIEDSTYQHYPLSSGSEELPVRQSGVKTRLGAGRRATGAGVPTAFHHRSAGGWNLKGLRAVIGPVTSRQGRQPKAHRSVETMRISPRIDCGKPFHNERQMGPNVSQHRCAVPWNHTKKFTATISKNLLDCTAALMAALR
jgi:hypothetical protein